MAEIQSIRYLQMYDFRRPLRIMREGMEHVALDDVNDKKEFPFLISSRGIWYLKIGITLNITFQSQMEYRILYLGG